MPLQEIQRIPVPSTEEFIGRYVAQRQPVIVTDLFSGQPLSDIRRLEDALAAFGNTKLLIRPEYQSVSGLRTVEPQVLSFAQYWQLVEADRGTRLLCTEYEIPARIMSTYLLPEIARARDFDQAEIMGLPRIYGDHDLSSNLFIANRGNCAHLHYDGDHRQVLLYQIFGRKELYLFQPRAGLKLKALDTRPGFSGVYLENLSEADKRELAAATDGYHAVLNPGEAVYMPMLIWHFFDYLDDAMSINIRFGRNRCNRFFCIDNFHRDYYMQNFGALLCDASRCETQYREEIAEMIAEYDHPFTNMAQKVAAMRDRLRAVCRRACPEADVDAYCTPELEQAEILKIVGDIGFSQRYAQPAVLSQSRPSGAMSPAQRRQIKESASLRGYTQEVLERVLYNRVGKRCVDELTKAEAAQVMWYMRSPGAAW